MNNLEVLATFLKSKLTEETGLKVYSNVAPLTETEPHICFFVNDGEPIVYTNQVQAFEIFRVTVHNWYKGAYDYLTAEKIQRIKRVQGAEIKGGFISSVIYKGQGYLYDDTDKGWFGIGTVFEIKVTKYDEI